MSDRIDTDAVLHRAMLANQLELLHEPVDIEGDLYRTTDDKQRDERDPLKMLHALSTEARNEVLLHGVLGTAAHTIGWVGSLMVAAGKETIEKAFKTIHEGDELKIAVKREYAVGACAMLCASALPQGFRDDLFGKFVQKGEPSPGAVSVVTTIRTRPDGPQIEEGMVANCRDGQRYALDRHITTAADLAVVLKQNPEFASRYRHDLAFKLGADSVLWASSHGQVPELERGLPAAPVVTALEVRG
jgi:hypothetical protein